MRKREKVIISFALLGIFISLSYLVVIPLSQVDDLEQSPDVDVSEEFEPTELPQVIDLDLPEIPPTELPPVVEIEAQSDPNAETFDPVEMDQPEKLPDNIGSNMEITTQTEAPEVIAIEQEPVLIIQEEISEAEDINTNQTLQEQMEFYQNLFSSDSNVDGEIAVQELTKNKKDSSYNSSLLFSLLFGLSIFFGIALTYVWWKEIKN